MSCLSQSRLTETSAVVCFATVHQSMRPSVASAAWSRSTARQNQKHLRSVSSSHSVLRVTCGWRHTNCSASWTIRITHSVLPVHDVIVRAWRHGHVIQVSAARAHFDVITRSRYVTCGHVATDARDFAIIALISTTTETELSTCRQLYWARSLNTELYRRLVSVERSCQLHSIYYTRYSSRNDVWPISHFGTNITSILTEFVPCHCQTMT